MTKHTTANTKQKNGEVKKQTPLKKNSKVVGDKKNTSNSVSIKATSKKNTVDNKIKPKKQIALKASDTIKVTFQIKYSTSFGQQLFVIGNHALLGNGDVNSALPLQFFTEDYWQVSVEMPKQNVDTIYNYVLKNADGSISIDYGNDKIFNTSKCKNELLLVDAWNDSSFVENTFFTEPFKEVLLPKRVFEIIALPKIFTHTFKVKCPLLSADETVCILGSANALGNWNIDACIPMQLEKKANCFTAHVDFLQENFPIAYKYGIYNIVTKTFVEYEQGNNRILYDTINKNKQTIINDAFVHVQSISWKGAGVAIPVFSLRSENSFGVGDFNDLKLLVDWCKSVGIKLVQLLPINDTTATHTNDDSYPYAAISAFALHPLYLNLSNIVSEQTKKLVPKINKERNRLNALNKLDYAATMQLKLSFIQKVFAVERDNVFASEEYQNYFQLNKHWLIPYAAFCYLRDEYDTANFSSWPTNSIYNADEINQLTNESSSVYNKVALHYYIQYQLHLQLKEALLYAHQNGIVFKGDIAIGVNRFGVDAWQQPNLFNMHLQAGAPPDDFAVKGQNWSFPTYNWTAMKENNFAWWKQRFEQMQFYFDAFRVDHILGFFRIWSIPITAVEGIMGFFEPAIPIHLNEFHRKGIWVDYQRYTKPFINDDILTEIFVDAKSFVIGNFLEAEDEATYRLKNGFTTQREVEELVDLDASIKQGLFDLISNVILFEVAGSQAQEFHFRFAMEKTLSFKYLPDNVKDALKNMYNNYFFERQNQCWKKEGLQKLPALKRVTNMLICGEDLGLVPACVPEVMQQLGLLSLEIQRMPKAYNQQFFHPANAPYLSVVTPSTHDMSTIRGWWQEDRTITQKFYNQEIGQYGLAPTNCEAWINQLIVTQHLYSPAMWSIFQLQDLLGNDENLRRANPADDRINVPANANNYWCYRMHLTLEKLVKANDFNKELKEMIEQSGR